MPNFIGYSPAPHQVPVHKAIADHPTASVFVILAPRQTGKTLLLENELLRASINNQNAVSLCISITLDGSRKIYGEILSAIKGTGILSKKNDSLLTIEFITGSIIYFRSGEQRDTLRGMTIKNGGLLVVDEAAFQSDEFFYSVLLPMTNVYKSDVIISSSPRFKTGFFFNYFMQGKNDTPGVYSFDFTEYDLSKFISREQKEAYRRVMPKQQFITEIEGKFLDGSSVLFEGFRECIGEEREELRKVYMGIDWSAGVGKDRTAVSVINQKGQQIYATAFNNLNTTRTVNKIADIYNLYSLYSPIIYAESNGVGKPYCDLMKDRGIRITEWTTTNKSKTDMVSHLQVAFENKEISILPDEAQEAELSYYEASYNPRTGNVTYNAPQGLNDDRCIALMLSWEAYLSRVTSGVYSFGVVRNAF